MKAKETIIGPCTLYLGDCLEILPTLEADSIDAVVTDPPYGLSFMGKEWDHGVPGEHFWREIIRVAKPGAHLLAFGGTRTFHRLACAIEDAGWEIRDCLMWVYGCLSEDTELLIDGRWEHYHKALGKGRALCYNPDSDEYQWQPIQELVEYEYDDTAFRIRGDYTDQIVSRNHRCLVERGGGYVFALAETLEREARVPVLESVQDLFDALPVPHEGTGAQTVRGAGHTRSDLVRVEPFHYKGKVWCIRVPSGAFVARRNGHVFVTGNSGFPKSLDVSKAIDKAAGAEREVVGRNPNSRENCNLSLIHI